MHLIEAIFESVSPDIPLIGLLSCTYLEREKHRVVIWTERSTKDEAYIESNNSMPD